MNVTAAGEELCPFCSGKISRFGGSYIYVRKNISISHQEVIEARKKGTTIRALALRFHVSVRQIYQILAEAKSK